MSTYTTYRAIFIAPLLYICFLSGCSQSEEINRECAAANKESFVARIQCINRKDSEKKELKKELAKIEKERKKENEARDCIAQDLPRMENLVLETRKEVNENSKLSEIKDKVLQIIYPDNQFNRYIEPVPSDDNIKEFVLVYEVKTKCNSKFNFLINIRANENGQIKFFNVWAQTAPEGYPSGFNKNLSTNFDEIRRNTKSIQKLLKDMDTYAKEKDNDHCAPNLSQSVRLSRLARYGAIRQTSQQVFTVSDSRGVSHGLTYDVFGYLQRCW